MSEETNLTCGTCELIEVTKEEQKKCSISGKFVRKDSPCLIPTQKVVEVSKQISGELIYRAMEGKVDADRLMCGACQLVEKGDEENPGCKCSVSGQFVGSDDGCGLSKEKVVAISHRMATEVVKRLNVPRAKTITPGPYSGS